MGALAWTSIIGSMPSHKIAAAARAQRGLPLLIDHFLRAARESGPLDFRPTRETIATLNACDWPGNVRELKHEIDPMAAMSSAGAAHDALPSALGQARGASMIGHRPGAGDVEPLHEKFLPRPAPVISIPESEKQAMVRALAAPHGEQRRFWKSAAPRSPAR
jgi:DNA-binding NtrC family response regulator